MSDNPIKNLREIEAVVYKSNAYLIYQRLLTHDLNYFVFDRNYQDLKSAITTFSKPEQVSLLFDTRESQVILYHLIRFFHNYLASAKTLIDQTRVVIHDWYKGTDFLREYQAQVDIYFTGNELSGFIEDLRNYALHYSLPIAGLQIHVHIDPETNMRDESVMFFIDKGKLLLWNNWKKGMEYLRKADNNINLEQLVDEYYQQVTMFHSWMNNRLEEIHATDLKWLYEMDQKQQDFVKTITSKPPRTILPRQKN